MRLPQATRIRLDALPSAERRVALALLDVVEGGTPYNRLPVHRGVLHLPGDEKNILALRATMTQWVVTEAGLRYASDLLA